MQTHLQRQLFRFNINWLCSNISFFFIKWVIVFSVSVHSVVQRICGRDDAVDFMGEYNIRRAPQRLRHQCHCSKFRRLAHEHVAQSFVSKPFPQPPTLAYSCAPGSSLAWKMNTTLRRPATTLWSPTCVESWSNRWIPTMSFRRPLQIGPMPSIPRHSTFVWQPLSDRRMW